jgi:hypothetical protein
MFEIVKITPFSIELKNDKGETLNVGYKKQTIKFLELRSKNIGDKVTLNSATSESGRLYCTDSMDFEKALFEAEKLQKSRQLLDYKIQHAKSMLELED